MPAAPLVVGSGSGILVTCTAANGRPAAEVSWRIDQLDGPVETVKNMTENPNGTTTVRSYLLVTPTRSMHGREVQCVVNHTALQHEDIVPYRISLHYAPQSVNITLKTSSEDPTFQCDVDANPAPTRYTWSRVNGEVLNPSIRPEGGRLVFLKMGSELNSLYVCEASNQYGQITGTLFVYTAGVSRDYYGGLLAGILVLFCLLSICTRNTLFQQRNCSGSSSLQAHQEIEPLDVEEQELDIQGEEQQEVGMQDVEQHEVGMQNVEQQELGIQDVEQQELGIQDVEQNEIGLLDVDMLKVEQRGVDTQEVDEMDVDMQETEQLVEEQQEVGMQDVEQQEAQWACQAFFSVTLQLSQTGQ
ncbi:poliovirus receptor-like isoform X4 [Paramormyrops kingsleyae]